MSDTNRRVLVAFSYLYGNMQRNGRAFFIIEDYEVIDEKWLRNKESELAESYGHRDPNILSFQILETKEGPTLKTFLFIYSYEGSSPQIKEYSTTTSTEALELFESESDINKTIVNEPRNGWWMISELIFRRSHFFPHSATDIR